MGCHVSSQVKPIESSGNAVIETRTPASKVYSPLGKDNALSGAHSILNNIYRANLDN